MIVALGLLLAAAIALPHLLRLEQAAPGAAAATWFAGLALRALTVILIVLYGVLFAPSTDAFVLLTHWCWEAVIPFAATHLGLNGHSIGDAAVLAPALVLAVSAISVGAGVIRAVRAARRLVRGHRLADGPLESVIVGGPEVMVAAAGLARPQVVISAGALLRLDDAELAAGVAHERGHIARGHRFVLLVGEFCRAVGRFIPGSTRAMRELSFHLERDADQWAVTHRHHPLDLASAICKAAGGDASPAVAPLAGGPNLTDRLTQLVDDPRPRHRRLSRIAAHLVAALLLALTLALAVMVPVAAAAGVTLDRHPDIKHCPH